MLADRMTDAVLDAAAHRHTAATEPADDEFEAAVALGEHATPATAIWTWADDGSVDVLSVQCGALLLVADDLSPATLAHLALQVAQSLPDVDDDADFYLDLDDGGLQ